jgi:DNA mismatch repair ATPase MutS
MTAHLLFKDESFYLNAAMPSSTEALTQDLELNMLFNAMALEDEFLFEISKKVVLTSLNDVRAVLYRQENLRDCLKNPAILRELYALAVEATESARKYSFGSYLRVSSILYEAVDLLWIFLGMLKRVRAIADRHSGAFASDGFRTLFSMLKTELSDDYFGVIQDHLDELRFHNGVLITAGLGKGNKGVNHVLRKLEIKKKGLVQRILEKRPLDYGFHIAEQDLGGGKALSELRERGINLVANALAQSADHIRLFFSMLKTELAFYVGCLNLHEQLVRMGEPTCFPVPSPVGERVYTAKKLYDICLALNMKQKIVGNDVDADGRDLIIVTGANEGGKSTFLRSIGLAQLMMQCGMFVPAETLHASTCEGVFTHYRRREDPTMKSGKLDEELSRMSAIVDIISPDSMVLFNESFSATNEREGSEIASQIVRALLERRIRVIFVTHFYQFSRGFYDRRLSNTLFLRAERKEDGVRTFRLMKGEPQQTSFGLDLYRVVFDGSRDWEAHD